MLVPKLTCHHDDAECGVLELADDGGGLRFEAVLHDEQTQEGEVALHLLAGDALNLHQAVLGGQGLARQR